MIEFPKWLYFSNCLHIPFPIEEEFNGVLVNSIEEEEEILNNKVSNNATIEALKAEAIELGIKIDNRWSMERLQAEIDKVK